MVMNAILDIEEAKPSFNKLVGAYKRYNQMHELNEAELWLRFYKL